MTARAAKIWECRAGQVDYGDDGVLRGPADAEGKARELTFKQLAAQLARTGGTIDGRRQLQPARRRAAASAATSSTSRSTRTPAR